MRGLPVHLGQHDVRIGAGEKSAALYGRQLTRIAKNQNGLAEGQKIATEFRIDHGTFVDDDELRSCNWAVLVEYKERLARFRFARAIDEAVNGARVFAALCAHDKSRLASEGAKGDRAIDVLGELFGERCFARASITKKAKQFWLAPLEPFGG